MNFLPGIFRYPTSWLLYRVLSINSGNCFTSLGQSASRFTAVSVCRRHLSLLPNSLHLLRRRILPHYTHRQLIRLRTIGCLSEVLTATKSGLVSSQRWFYTGPSCLSNDQLPPISPIIKTTEFSKNGEHVSRTVPRSELLFTNALQPRDIRFSAASSLYLRGSAIILKLQHIKAILNTDSLVLLDSDHPAIQEFIPELQKKLAAVVDDPLPFELRALDALCQKMFSILDERLSQLQPALRDVLNSLLDPRFFSVDRGELHILLLHSRNLSEFHSLVKDIEATLIEILDSEQDMAEMYLTHWATTGTERDEDDIEDVYNILESYALQAENIQSEIQKLRELIDQSESIILINLDSQRNIMLRLSLQLSMGMFSATIAGLIGMAFGMNLDSSLEESTYAFWVVTGVMILICGLLWRRLLRFLGKSLDHAPIKRLPINTKKQVNNR